MLREGNRSADFVARLEESHRAQFLCMEAPPKGVRAFLSKDV